MELGDILVKVAQNARLTPQELDFLNNAGKETQIRNSQLAGSKNSSEDLAVGALYARAVFVGKNVLTGYTARFTATTSTTSGSTATVASWTTAYNDGFRVDGGTIYIPKKAIYQVIISASFDAGTPPGVAYAEAVIKINGTRSFPAANGSIIPSFPLPFLTGVSEKELNVDDAITFTMLQNSTATVNCYCSISFREIRTA